MKVQERPILTKIMPEQPSDDVAAAVAHDLDDSQLTFGQSLW